MQSLCSSHLALGVDVRVSEQVQQCCFGRVGMICIQRENGMAQVHFTDDGLALCFLKVALALHSSGDEPNKSQGKLREEQSRPFRTPLTTKTIGNCVCVYHCLP